MSVHGRGEDHDDDDVDEGSYLMDPDQLRDRLPQPYRMIDKVVVRLLDRTWEVISQRESVRNAEKSKHTPPTMTLSAVTQLPGSTSCMACSPDGRVIFVGHAQGLSVTSITSFSFVTAWLQDGTDVTHIHVTCMGDNDNTSLLATIDDMGAARVFAYHDETIHLIRVINELEDVNKRSICTTFELSKGGEFGAASMSCNGAVWLQVYQFPLEAWMKDVQLMTSPKQAHNNPSGVTDVKWSPVTVLMKIKPPNTLDPAHHHMASMGQDAAFRSGTMHFLMPCAALPGPGLIGSTHLAGSSVSLCLWWSSTQDLLHYWLCRAPKDKLEVEREADVSWQNAHQIVCSAVSDCSRYVAVGLDNALVTVWDRLLGAPLSVILVSAAEQDVFTRILFMDYNSRPAHCEVSTCSFWGLADTKIHLLVVCKSRATHVITAGRGTQSWDVHLPERPKDPAAVPSYIASVPFLQGLVLLVQKNGRIILQDVINKTLVCRLIPPKSHMIANPWNPVITVNVKHQTVFIRGEQLCSRGEAATDDSLGHLLAFHFGEAAIFDSYELTLPSSLKASSFVSLEEECNLHLQQRLLSRDERNEVMTRTWRQLHEHVHANVRTYVHANVHTHAITLQDRRHTS